MVSIGRYGLRLVQLVEGTRRCKALFWEGVDGLFVIGVGISDLLSQQVIRGRCCLYRYSCCKV